MLYRTLAVLSLAAFTAFLAVLSLWVDGIALKSVLLAMLLMAAYDFFRGRGHSRPHDRRRQ
jgi:hypothetical protein